MSIDDDLSVILKICTFLGVIPSYSRKSGTFLSPKWRPYLQTVVLTIWYIFSAYGSSAHVVNTRTSFNVIWQNFLLISLVFYVINAWKITKNGALFDELLQNFRTFDDDLYKLINIRLGFRYVSHFIVGSMSFFITYLIADLWFMVYGKMLYNQYYLYQIVVSQIGIIINLLSYSILKEIRIRLLRFNAIINSKQISVRTLDVLVNLHSNLCNAVDLLNLLFGRHLLYMQISVIIYTLLNVDWVLTDVVHMQYVNLAENLVWFVYILINSFLVVSQCETVANESKSGIAILCKLQYLQSHDPVTFNKFSVLIKQITSRDVSFSAAGFFNVNYNMLFNLFNIIVTYVVVIVQVPTKR